MLDATRELLGEVGFERLNTNEICRRAGATPPAFYNYFHDKYDILEEIGFRLLNRQNEALFVWLVNGGAWAQFDDPAKAVEDWYWQACAITDGEPGAIWTMRAIRALPGLAQARLESQRMLTDRLFEIYRPLVRTVPDDLLWQRLRLACELGYMVDELALEEQRIERSLLLREAARIVAGVFNYSAG